MYYLFSLPAVDILSMGISKIFYPCEHVHHNRRWFLIHTYINGMVTYYNFSDTVSCLIDPARYCDLTMSSGSFMATNLMIAGHIYHMIVFYPYLKKEEWFHHLVMMGFNGLSIYIMRSKLQAASAFFLCGLPGLIDYFLLWCVKMNFINPILEKNIYLFIASYLRSPGSIVVSYVSVPVICKHAYKPMFWYCGLLSALNFWNGQYYLTKSCMDYEKWKTRKSNDLTK
jgi:hypothetical protein